MRKEGTALSAESSKSGRNSIEELQTGTDQIAGAVRTIEIGSINRGRQGRGVNQKEYEELKASYERIKAYGRQGTEVKTEQPQPESEPQGTSILVKFAISRNLENLIRDIWEDIKKGK